VVLLLRERLGAQPASLPRIRHAATAALAEIGISDREFLGGVALALSEAVGNVIQHAYPNGAGDIDVSMLSNDHEIVITVADTGVGIDNAADSPGLGIGLQLIGRIATTWTISSDASGTAITMRFASPAR
jgi:anti-sigma regulatory factor (Ser/Thr protein kinase)